MGAASPRSFGWCRRSKPATRRTSQRRRDGDPRPGLVNPPLRATRSPSRRCGAGLVLSLGKLVMASARTRRRRSGSPTCSRSPPTRTGCASCISWRRESDPSRRSSSSRHPDNRRCRSSSGSCQRRGRGHAGANTKCGVLQPERRPHAGPLDAFDDILIAGRPRRSLPARSPDARARALGQAAMFGQVGEH